MDNLGRTAVDTAHPRFLPNKSPNAAKTNYCRQCDLYFENTLEEIDNHFDSKTHIGNGKCVYCKKDYFTYYVVNKLEYYHNCRNSQFHY